MLVGKRARELLHARLLVFVVAEEEIELPHGLGWHRGGRQQRLVRSALVEVREEPVLEPDGSTLRAVLDPPVRIDAQNRAGLHDRLANRRTARELAIEAIEEQLIGSDVNGISHGKHAADPDLDQARSHGAENGRPAQRATAASGQDDERHLVFHQQVAQPVGAHQVGFGGERDVVRVLEAKRADLRFREECTVAIEVHNVVGIALRLTQHFLQTRQRRRGAEVEMDMAAEWIQCFEQRLRGEPRIDEAGVVRPADDVEHPERKLHLARGKLGRLFELPAHGDALGEAASGIGHEFPRQAQERALRGGDG
ncbi:MAG TPA: hypothetical protein VGO11_13335 [Chthoniobacteraceae bacterium]|nr:hypothetical protein [Chthoniobacteraceae bacterium]